MWRVVAPEEVINLTMTTQPTTPKRWRPRFSLRTLVVLVTLVCGYFGCWEITKRFGISDIVHRDYVLHGLSDDEELQVVKTLSLEGVVSSPSPFVVSNQTTFNRHFPFTGGRIYYFWFFGYVAELPYEREVPTS